MPTVGHLPMAIFAAPVETRAITPGPAVKGSLQPTVPFVFERSAAASLGIVMPTVPMGQVQIPKITTAPPADTLAKDGAAPATAAAVTLVNQAPVRIAGSFEVRVEDLAVMPSLEAALSESLQGSMSNELDEQVFNGAAGELNGLFVQAANVNAAGAVETFATGIARFASLVDGRHCYDLSDLRAVIGSGTFARYAGQFSGNGAVSLFDYLRINLGSIRVSDRVPAVSGNAQKGIVVLSASAEMPKIHVLGRDANCERPLLRRGRWQGHDHQHEFGESALHSTQHEPGEGSSPEGLIRRSRHAENLRGTGCCAPGRRRSGRGASRF